MMDWKEFLTKAIMDRYEEIVGERPYERWPGVFFPQMLVEYVDKEGGMKVTFHIGVEEENEDTMQGIQERLNLVLNSIDFREYKLHDAGESPVQRVAVNDKGNMFLQKPVHWVLK